jgi:hypothetical protein
MKALRIKTFDHDLNLSRFEIVLLRDIGFQKLNFSSIKNEAFLDDYYFDLSEWTK